MISAISTPDRLLIESLPSNEAKVRIDRWLWAARFFKTRSLAKAAIEGGKVHVDGQRVKPAKEVRPGQTLEIRRGDTVFVVIIEKVSDKRGAALVAQALYIETASSREQREAVTARRRMERAGLTIPKVRPSKKQRRALLKLKK